MPAISSPDMIFREVVQGLCKGSYVPGQRRVGEAVLSGDMRRAELAARRHVRNTSAVLNQVADG